VKIQTTDSCRQEVINMIKSGQITGSSLRPCLKIWKQFGKYISIAERLSYFLYLISKEFFADDLELQKNATEEYLELLLTLSNKLFQKANKTKNTRTLLNARGVANQALKIIEAMKGYPINPNLHSELLLAMGSTTA
jgi:hypothetical protein